VPPRIFTEPQGDDAWLSMRVEARYGVDLVGGDPLDEDPALCGRTRDSKASGISEMDLVSLLQSMKPL
jgi:hypothetical protein